MPRLSHSGSADHRGRTADSVRQTGAPGRRETIAEEFARFELERERRLRHERAYRRAAKARERARRAGC